MRAAQSVESAGEESGILNSESWILEDRAVEAGLTESAEEADNAPTFSEPSRRTGLKIAAGIELPQPSVVAGIASHEVGFCTSDADTGSGSDGSDAGDMAGAGVVLLASQTARAFRALRLRKKTSRKVSSSSHGISAGVQVGLMVPLRRPSMWASASSLRIGEGFWTRFSGGGG